MTSRLEKITTTAAKQIVLRMATRLRHGRLRAVLPDGRRRSFGDGGGAEATIRIHDDAFFMRVLLGGEIGFGETYVDGLWTTDDLPGLLTFAINARSTLELNSTWIHTVTRFKDLRLHRSRRNTIGQAKDNIHAHYDLGNKFFELWLDDTMTYSCAYFSHPEEPLESAQRTKYSMLCEKLRLRPTDHLLEIGSGWGGFAMHAAENYGCKVTSITISQEQLELARERVERARLSSQVEVRFQDYRGLAGQYDKIASIEMFEAVGAEYFDTFFRVCDRVLKPGGLFAMQTIAVPDRSFASVRDGVNWVQKYIFPGGMLPSIAEIERALRTTALNIGAVEDIGLHYATTLRRWRERFLDRSADIRALGFDERFLRMWEYYLAACEAGFLTRNTLDYQVVFEKAPAERMRGQRPSVEEIPVELARGQFGGSG